VQNEQVA